MSEKEYETRTRAVPVRSPDRKKGRLAAGGVVGATTNASYPSRLAGN